MVRFHTLWPVWLICCSALTAEIDFNREIRPILSDNCFACHGPDKKHREASLRLDTFQGATEGGELADPTVPDHSTRAAMHPPASHEP